MPTKCEIIFDHPNGIYNSGDILNGHVNLKTETVKSIRGISIKILGYTKATWSKGQGKSSATYVAYEQYLNSVTYVTGSSEGKSFDFAPGIYNYSFTCALPRELPSSCDYTNGKTIYKVIVTFEYRLRFDKSFINTFMVNHIRDLNLDPTIKLPRQISSRKQIFGGEVYGEIQIPCGGYVSGQSISIQLNICNNSNNELIDGKIKLEKLCTFTSIQNKNEVKMFVDEIGKIKLNNIPSLCRKEFREKFNLSNLVPTQRTNSLNIEYILRVCIKLRCFSALELKIPVTIGTIGITDYSTCNNFNTIVPVSNFYTSSGNRFNDYSNINANDSSSFTNNYGNSINQNDVTIIKSFGNKNKDSSMNYGWQLQ